MPKFEPYAVPDQQRVKSPTPEGFTNLSKLPKDTLLKRDVFGRNILHLVILCNRADLLRQLLRNPEAKCIIGKTDYENGWNCLHYTIFFKRLTCFKIILEYIKGSNPGSNTLSLSSNSLLLDLIRCKDRTRNTPLQLLENDFKQMLWIPKYVDDNDQVSFEYRFAKSPTKSSSDTTAQQSAEGTSVNGESSMDTKDSEYNKKVRRLKDHHIWWDPRRGGSDIYMFGSNLNNHLGLGDSTDRTIPSKLASSYFKAADSKDVLSSPRFKTLKISKNHSIVLTKDGSLFSCGIGSRGRLGHGLDHMNNCYRFKKIDFFESGGDALKRKTVKDCCISSNHSLAVTTENEVYTWGLNAYCQLAYKPVRAAAAPVKEFADPFEAEPRLVIGGDIKKNSSTIRGASVSSIHSVVYTKHDIISWGLNIGQMGFQADNNNIEIKVNRQNFKGSIQSQPRKVSLRDEIKFLETSESCTCVVTVNNDIHLYFQNQHIKLPKIPTRGSFDKNFHVFNPVKLTKPPEIVKVCCRSHENIGFLLDSGDILGISLREDTNLVKFSKSVKYTSLWKSHDHDLRVSDFDMASDGSIVLTTSTGLVFMKSVGSNKHRANSMDTSLPIPVKNKFKRIDFVNKIVRVYCDENFASFGFIRDDIDLIPLQLQQNSFVKDMEYLSILPESDMYRKQEQLFENSVAKGTYTSDFVYPVEEEEEELDFYDSDEEENEHKNDDEDLKLDLWYTKHVRNFDSNYHKRSKTRSTYEQLLTGHLDSLKEYLKADLSSILIRLQQDEDENNKGYDCYITTKSDPEVKIGIHKRVFMVRSPFFRKVLDESVSGSVLFVAEGYEGRFVDNENHGFSLVFDSPLDFKALLIFVYFIYTNQVISIWDDYPAGIHCPADIKEIKTQFERLGRLFQVTDALGTIPKNRVYYEKMRSLLEVDLTEGDLRIKLGDGELRCSSYILSSRSAFFETTLASRWNTELDTLEFDKLSVDQFMLVLKHIYGYSDYGIFDDLKSNSSEQSEFISSLLEMVQLADELLLFQLKDLCQLAIKDLVTSENVMTLLMHAFDLNAKKLFANCCWYIFNNLEVVLLDQSLLAISNEILLEVEKQVNVFNNCKRKDFESGKSEAVDGWMVSNSGFLINSFISDMTSYNEEFMSDEKGFSSFEPLIDVKIDQTKAEPKRRRKSSRKSSTHELNPELQEIRRSTLSQAQISESAIDNDDEFEVVSTKKKNKKVDFTTPEGPPSPGAASADHSASSSVNSSTVDLRTSVLPKASAVAPGIVSNGTTASNGRVPDSKFPVLGQAPVGQRSSSAGSSSTKVPTTTSTKGLSPHSNWASKSPGSSSSNPITAATPKAELWGAKAPKPAKMSGTRSISGQKMKKIPLTELNSTKPMKASFNWASSSASGSSSKTTAASSAANAQKFPVLSKQPTNTTAASASNLTLSDIMLEESLKIEEAKLRDTQRKTLQEIQQEEEFAKWWEEEAARVQQQMQAFEIRSKPKGRKRSAGKHKPVANNRQS